MEILIVNNTSPFVIDIVNMIKDLNIPFQCKLYSEIKTEELSLYGAIILSGRRNYNRETNVKNNKIIEYVINLIFLYWAFVMVPRSLIYFLVDL